MNTKGQVLIELLVAIGISVVIIPAVFSGIASGREGVYKQTLRLSAVSYAEEAIEAVRTIKDENWENIETDGVYHPVAGASNWTLAAGEEAIGDFTRSITIESVGRDGSGNIAESGGTTDPSIKKITATVTWGTTIPSVITTVTYMTRLTNIEHLETTVADFEAGNLESTNVTNVEDGEVQLGGGGSGDWCKPEDIFVDFDLEGNGVAQAITAIPGEAFVGTGQNASGYAFYKVDISDTNPPVPTSPSSNWYTKSQDKTNAVFGEDNYAYLATDTNSRELIIVDTNTNPFSQVGTFNPSANTDGISVFVLGNVGYLGAANNTLYTFDLSSKTGARPQLGSIALPGTPKKVFVVGTYAYVAISGNTGVEMQMVDVSNPSSMSLAGIANTDSAGAVDVHVNDTGTRAYLATALGAGSQKEFFIIDTETKTGTRPILGSFDTNGMDPRGVRVVPGNRAIVVGHNGEEYQVLNITDETSPSLCGGLDLGVGINSIWSVIEEDGDAYSYILTEDSAAELRIIEGGPGGGFAHEGTYTSAPFDTGKTTAFNRFLVTYAEPVTTDIKFQIAAGDTIGGVCDASAMTYIGPDGTSGSFYEDGGLIPFDDDGAAFENPSQCFAYKTYLTADDGSPILYDFTLNYSP